MHSDPIADMLTRIRNAAQAGHTSVTVNFSRVNKSILNVLKEKKFVREVNVVKGAKFNEIKVGLLEGHKNIHLERISKPGRRVYTAATDIKPVLDGFGLDIISTSKGMMASPDAFKMKLGGEVVCRVW